MSSKVQRKLTTILAADAEGYSRGMEADEVGTFAELHAAREVFGAAIERHGGRIANTAGDGLIADFPSVVEAVECAIELQRELGERNAERVDALHFRIGIHLGDVMVDGRDLLGEGVNLAARLQSMAEPGGILISQQVFDQVHSKLSVRFDYVGERRPKNFSHAVGVYEVQRGPRLNVFEERRQPRGEDAPAPQPPKPTDIRHRTIRDAQFFGGLFVILLAINFASGLPFWVQYPGIVLLALFAVRAAPLVAPSWMSRQLTRLLVLIGALGLLNIVTWDGSPWALIVGAALIAVWLARSYLSGSTSE